MRLVLALGLAIVALLAAVTPVAGKATIQVTDASPFTVRGVGFAPSERVIVVAQIKGRHVKSVTASKTGTFLLPFLNISLGNCPAYIVRATGHRGSRAYLRVLHECMPLGPPP